jgi:nucleotide-binding universal stress UspA family protein
MLRHIIVPVDGSEFAERALPMAVSIARRSKATLQLLRVHVPVAALYTGSELSADMAVDARLREGEAAYVDGLAKRIADLMPPGKVRPTVGDGLAVDGICEHALAVPADLVVMATHGRGAFSRFWLGSVANALLHRLPVPMLFIRPHNVAPALTADLAPRRILVPLDGSELAEQVLPAALALGRLTEAQFTLLRVVEPIASPEGESLAPVLDRQANDAEAYLDGMAQRLRDDNVFVETRVVVDRPAAAAILEQAETYNHDLIALGSHGRGGVARLLLGSVADKVIRGAMVPVLVHRPLPKKNGGLP